MKNSWIYGKFNKPFWLLMAALSFVFAVFTNPARLYGAFSRAAAFVLLISFLVCWGVFAEIRIADRKIRHSIITIAALYMGWLFIRTVKFETVTDPVITRYLWYLYYLPIIFSAFFFFVITDVLSVEDEGKRKRRALVMFIVSGALLLLVLTNEFHEMVFDKVTEGHRAGYYFVAAFVVLTMANSLVRIFTTTIGEGFQKSIIKPLLIIVAVLVYSILYIIPFTGRYVHVFDYTMVYIVGMVLFIESLISIGAIPSNKDYQWCFNHSSVRAQITDKDGNVAYRSVEARPILKSEFAGLMEGSALRISPEVELVSAKLRGGHVIWERDVKDINKLMEILSENEKSIKEANESLKESIEIEKRQIRAYEQNRLYDLTFTKVADSVQSLEESIKRAEKLSGQELIRELKRIDILGVFVKRKSNLLILGETGLSDFSGELKLCFKETYDNLKDMHTEGSFLFLELSPVTSEGALLIYQSFETVIEAFLDGLISVNSILKDEGNCFCLTMSLGLLPGVYREEENRLLELTGGVFFETEWDENEVTVSMHLPKKGGMMHD